VLYSYAEQMSCYIRRTSGRCECEKNLSRRKYCLSKDLGRDVFIGLQRQMALQNKYRQINLITTRMIVVLKKHHCRELTGYTITEQNRTSHFTHTLIHGKKNNSLKTQNIFHTFGRTLCNSLCLNVSSDNVQLHKQVNHSFC